MQGGGTRWTGCGCGKTTTTKMKSNLLNLYGEHAVPVLVVGYTHFLRKLERDVLGKILPSLDAEQAAHQPDVYLVLRAGHLRDENHLVVVLYQVIDPVLLLLDVLCHLSLF